MVGVSLTKFGTNTYTTIQFLDIKKEIADKISNKTLTTISQGVTGQKDNSVAIIPMLEDRLVSFVYLS